MAFFSPPCVTALACESFAYRSAQGRVWPVSGLGLPRRTISSRILGKRPPWSRSRRHDIWHRDATFTPYLEFRRDATPCQCHKTAQITWPTRQTFINRVQPGACEPLCAIASDSRVRPASITMMLAKTAANCHEYSARPVQPQPVSPPCPPQPPPLSGFPAPGAAARIAGARCA